MTDDDSPMWVPPARPQPTPEWPDYPEPPRSWWTPFLGYGPASFEADLDAATHE